VKSFHLKIAGRESGPYNEAHIAQMFADGSVNRHTPCKPAGASESKSIDDYLPMLKYGTQLPPPTTMTEPAAGPSAPLSAERVAIVDFDIPFGSVLKIMFKWGLQRLLCFAVSCP